MKKYAIIVAIILCSCNRNVTLKDIAVTDVDINQLCDAEEMFESYSDIILETTDECLIATIDKIEMVKDYICILDKVKSAIYIFSNDGHFVNKIDKRGKGNGEYISADDFSIYKNYIYVLSRAEKKINIYSTEECKYLSSITLDDWYNYIHVVSSRMMWLYSERSNEKGYDFVLYDYKDGVDIAKHLEFASTESYGFNNSPFNICGGSIYVTKPFDYTIYRLNDKTCSPSRLFHFNTSYQLPKDVDDMKYSEASADVRYKPVVKMIGDLSIYNDILFVSYEYFVDGKGLRSHISKVDKDDSVMTYRYGDKTSTNFPYLDSPIAFIGNNVISYIPSSSLLLREESSKSRHYSDLGVTDNSNPIVFIHKLLTR